MKKTDAGTGSRCLFLVAVLLVSLGLNGIGIRWGRTGGVPWDFDSIAGLRTFKEGDYLFGEWRDKYPRGQYLILSPVYRTLLARWYGNLQLVPRAEVEVLADPEDARRFDSLIAISNATSALMGTATVAVLYLLTARLFKDRLAALLAACALSCSQMFVFYSHLGNLDTPTTFWYACAAYFGVRAVQTRGFPSFILLGVTAAWSVGTKDATAGYVLGLGIVVCVASLSGRPDELHAVSSGSTKGTIVRLATGALVFLVVFFLLNDVFFHMEAFLGRLGHWLGGPGISDYNKGFSGQLALLHQAYQHLYLSLGWPLLIASAAAAVFCILRYPRMAMFGVVPLACFYVLVIVNIHMSAPRFYLPGFVAIALLFGKGAADWWRWAVLPRLLRYPAVILVLGLSFLYCVGLDLEMINDTRYAAEAWFLDNVQPGATLAALCPLTIAPRLQPHGYHYDCRWGQPTRRDILTKDPAWPDYVLLSEKWTDNPALFDPAFKEELLSGALGYEPVAYFRNKFLYPRKSIFGIAGRPRPKLNQISPEVIVLRKEGVGGGEDVRMHGERGSAP